MKMVCSTILWFFAKLTFACFLNNQFFIYKPFKHCFTRRCASLPALGPEPPPYRWGGYSLRLLSLPCAKGWEKCDAMLHGSSRSRACCVTSRLHLFPLLSLTCSSPPSPLLPLLSLLPPLSSQQPKPPPPFPQTGARQFAVSAGELSSILADRISGADSLGRGTAGAARVVSSTGSSWRLFTRSSSGASS